MPTTNYLFTTNRLGFREWRDEDLSSFAEMNADAAVMEYFPKVLTKEESSELAHWLQKHIEDFGYGLYAVDELEQGQFIGFIGFKTVKFEASFTPTVEIGWRLARHAWGRGLATEGAKKCVEIAKSDFGIKMLHSFTALSNARSERVMQKIGMTKVGEFEHPKIERSSALRKHVLYEKSLT